MKIDTLFTPLFNETEKMFDGSTVVLIDVLRASTTICAALQNGAKEIIASASIEKASQLYTSLDRDIRFLGGERNNVMPNSFGAGNSPLEYTTELISNKCVVFTTTNGTQALLKAKHAETLLVAAFVNFRSTLQYLESIINNKSDGSIFFMCAGSHGRFAYEDVICSGAYISELVNMFPDTILTDSSHAAMSLYRQNSNDIKGFLITKEHSKELIRDGFEKDIDVAFEFDRYPVIPYFDGISIKKMKLE